MKIAFFCERFPLVSEAFIASSAAALMDRGHDLTIFALDGRGPSGSDRQPKVVSHALESQLHVPAVVGSFGQRAIGAPFAMASLVGKRGVQGLNALNLGIFRRSAVNLRSLYLAGMFSRTPDFDILHCQFGHLAHDVLRLRQAGFVKGRVIVHFRGYDITQIPQFAGPGFYTPVFSQADWFVANSDFFRDRALELGAPDDRIDVSYSGIDLSNFSFRSPLLWRPGETLRIMTTGRLVEKKGIIYALEALARLKHDGVSIDYDIVGDGPERPALEAAIARLGLTAEVKLLGAKGHQTIAPLLAGAHLFLAPSVTAADSNADAPINTLKEAMAIGVPVVSSRCGGIPELVDDGQTGFLAPERDSIALHARIGDALQAAPLWPAMAQRARSVIETRFDLSSTTDSLLSIYSKVLAA